MGFVDNGTTSSRHPGLLLTSRLRKRTPKFKMVNFSKICFEAKIIKCFGYGIFIARVSTIVGNFLQKVDDFEVREQY